MSHKKRTVSCDRTSDLTTSTTGCLGMGSGSRNTIPIAIPGLKASVLPLLPPWLFSNALITSLPSPSDMPTTSFPLASQVSLKDEEIADETLCNEDVDDPTCCGRKISEALCEANESLCATSDKQREGSDETKKPAPQSQTQIHASIQDIICMRDQPACIQTCTHAQEHLKVTAARLFCAPSELPRPVSDQHCDNFPKQREKLQWTVLAAEQQQPSCRPAQPPLVHAITYA